MILRLTISQFHFIYKRMTYIKNDFYNFIYKKKKKSFNPIFIYKKTPFTIFILKNDLRFLFRKIIFITSFYFLKKI